MRADRHTVEYLCDQCPARVVVFDERHCPFDAEEWPLTPKGWFSVSYDRKSPAHLCSVKCLQEHAAKLVTAEKAQ